MDKKMIVGLMLGVSLVFVPFIHAATTTNIQAGTVEEKSSSKVDKDALMIGNEESSTIGATPVDYFLPYPGILTDHPLYFLKQFRDWLLERLIADSTKRAEFYLLQSDKFLGMGVAFGEKGNWTGAIDVIKKSSNYMDLAVTELSSVKQGGQTVPGYVVDRMSLALSKHNEVLADLAGKAQEGKEAIEEARASTLKKANDIVTLK